MDQNIPGKMEEYRRFLSKHTGGKLATLTVHANWKRRRGDAIEAFLDQLIKNTRSGSVEYRVKNFIPIGTSSKQTVFVVHGRNIHARNAMFNFLRSIGLNPMEWSIARSETKKTNPYIGEILDAAFSKAQAIVVLMTPDDIAYLQEKFQKDEDPSYEKQPTPQARPNVLFEAGMSIGRHPERTVLVELGKLRPFSDIAGRHIVMLTNSTKDRQELAKRLRDAGCSVNLDGTDWHTVGDFDKAID